MVLLEQLLNSSWKSYSYILELESEPVHFLTDTFFNKYSKNKQYLADFIGTNNDNITLIRNSTTGVNQVLNSLPSEKGDEWLITSHIYGACLNAINHYSKKYSTKVNIVNIPFENANDNDILTALEKAITKKTTFALIDHISSASATIFPVKDIIDLLQQKNIKVLIDGAHAPGMIPLNIDELHPDYYVGNCHKWLCAPKGTAFLFVGQEHQNIITPLVISHHNDMFDNNNWSNQFIWDGTNDFSPFLCIEDSIEYMKNLFPGGWEEIMKHNSNLIIEAGNHIVKKLDLDFNISENYRASILSLPLNIKYIKPQKFNQKLPIQETLFNKYKIEVPIVKYPGTNDLYIRISAQIYNSIEQYEYLAESLLKILKS
ncbi:MAG: aminotransferase class V-fold PLP-dependent enzyme [Saprospiraceae bacterium]